MSDQRPEGKSPPATPVRTDVTTPTPERDVPIAQNKEVFLRNIILYI